MLSYLYPIFCIYIDVCFLTDFQLTIYDRAIRLPLPFPSSPGTPTATLPSPDQNAFIQATLLITENLKGQQLTICKSID